MTDSPTDIIYFGVSVTRRRAEFLARMLKVALCVSCGREQDECDADPCEGIITLVTSCQICRGAFKSSDLDEAMVCIHCATRPCVG